VTRGFRSCGKAVVETGAADLSQSALSRDMGTPGGDGPLCSVELMARLNRRAAPALHQNWDTAYASAFALPTTAVPLPSNLIWPGVIHHPISQA
jgi:hypothetical protein